jgi:hypothetical protein
MMFLRTPSCQVGFYRHYGAGDLRFISDSCRQGLKLLTVCVDVAIIASVEATR